MNWGKQRALAWGLAAFVAWGLSACGGGGGGSSYPNIGSYTGLTTPATIDKSNAASFPTAAVQADNNMSGAGESIPFGISAGEGEVQGGRTLDLAKLVASVLEERFLSEIIQTEQGGVLMGAGYSEPGDCGGSMSFGESVGGSAFKGTVTYSNYCVTIDPWSGSELVMHGKLTYSGTFAGTAAPENISTIGVSIDYLKVTYRDTNGTFSDEVAGSINFAFDTGGYPYPSQVESTLRWEHNGAVYQVSDDGTARKFYHPEHGWVSIESALVFGSCEGGLPHSGTLTIMGQSGGLQVTPNGDCATYQLCWLNQSGAVTSCEGTSHAW